MTDKQNAAEIKWDSGLKAQSDVFAYENHKVSGPLWGAATESGNRPALAADGPVGEDPAAWALSMASPGLFANILTRALNEGSDANWSEWLSAAKPYLSDLANRGPEWQAEWAVVIGRCLTQENSPQQTRFAQWMALMDQTTGWQTPNLSEQQIKALSDHESYRASSNFSAWAYLASCALAGGAKGAGAVYWARAGLRAFEGGWAFEKARNSNLPKDKPVRLLSERLAFFVEIAAKSGALDLDAELAQKAREIAKVPRQFLSRENFESWWPLAGVACAGLQAFEAWQGDDPLAPKRMQGRLARIACKQTDPDVWMCIFGIASAISADVDPFLKETVKKSESPEFSAWAEHLALSKQVAAASSQAKADRPEAQSGSPRASRMRL